jgi:hypothetical protein
LDVVVIPALQVLLGHAQEGSGVGDVAEADQFGRLLQKTLGSVSALRQRGVARGEVAVAVRAVELVGTDDQFDRLRPHGQILDRPGVVGTVDGVRGPTAAGTQSEGHPGDDRQTQGIGRRIAALVDDLEVREAQGLGQELQTILFGHGQLLSLTEPGDFPQKL